MIKVDVYRCILHPDTRREKALDTMMRIFARDYPQVYEGFWQELHRQGLLEDYKFEVMGYSHKDPFCRLYLELDDARGLYMKMWLSHHITLTPIPELSAY